MKLYESKEWCKRKYLVEHWTEKKMADYCKTDQSTINRWLRKHGLKRDK